MIYRILILFLGIIIIAVFGCMLIMNTEQDSNRMEEEIMAQTISKEEALQIAHQDAQIVYRDLSPYEIIIEKTNGDWKVDYELMDKTMRGGGPHYLISGQTGEILDKRYEQ